MSLELLYERLTPRYRDISPMAQGGMGLLLRGTEAATGRAVVIKMLAGSLAGDVPSDMKARFLREAQAIARLSHPFIVRVLELGDRADVPYFVMEMVEGQTLDVFARGRKKVDIAHYLRIALDICDGLLHAHQKGIVHRDLKPANLVVLPQGGVKILDFGLAKVDDEPTYLTRTGQIMGTPNYMAPEQLLGGEVDARADLYGLAVIIYELLTQVLPFPGDSFFAKTQRAPEKPSARNREITDTLDGVLLKALAIAPADRQASLAEFKWQLSSCLRDYLELADVPLMGGDWKTLLQSDLERLAASAAHPRDAVALKEGRVRDVVMVEVRVGGAVASEGVLQREGIGFVRDRVLYILTQELARYGGALDRYEPDGLVGFFGSQATGEQDAQRAVAAGLAMIERATQVGGMLKANGLTFTTSVVADVARLSVNAGEGVDESAFGLKDLARPGPGVWVTEALAARVASDYTVAETTGPLREVKGPKVPRTAAAGVADVAFVGRDLELTVIGEAAGMAREMPTAMFIRGEPGIGKTRLVAEWLSRNTELVKNPVRGAAAAFPRAPYKLIVSMVHSILGVSESATPAQVSPMLATKLRALASLAERDNVEVTRVATATGAFTRPGLATTGGFRAVIPGRNAVAAVATAPMPQNPNTMSTGAFRSPLSRVGIPGGSSSTTLQRPNFARDAATLAAPLGHLLGLPDATHALEGQPAAAVRDAVTQAVAQLMAHHARWLAKDKGELPVFICEDLQWIDELSQEILEAFLFALPAPALLILTARAPWELPERWRRALRCGAVDLTPLDTEQSRQLVKALAPTGTRVLAIEERVLALSGGNPLFLEETVHMLAAGGAGPVRAEPIREGRITRKVRTLDRRDSTWIPQSIHALVAARVDALAANDREALQMAAALGVEVDSAVLEEMAAEFWGDASGLSGALSRLVAAALLSETFEEGRSTFRFRQSLVREVVYSSTLACNRRALHELAARSVDKLARGVGEDASDLLAYHLARAARWAEALTATQAALATAVARYDHEAALRLAGEALELLEISAGETGAMAPGLEVEARFSIYEHRETAHEVRGDHDAQRIDLEELLKLARAMGDDRRLANVLNRLSRFRCWHLGDQVAAQQAALEAVELARKIKDPLAEADAMIMLASSHSLLGNRTESNRFFKWAQKLYKQLDNMAGVAGALCYMAINHAELGQVPEALKMVEEALAIDREYDFRRGIGRDLRTLGQLHANAGNAELALELIESALASDRAIGYRQGQAYDLAFAARPLMEVGCGDLALARLEEALELARSSKLRFVLGDVLLSLAHLHLEQGGGSTVEAAWEYALEADKVGGELGLLGLQVTALIHRARCELARGRAPEALALSEKAVGYLRGGPLPAVLAHEVWYYHFRILTAAGRTDDAAAALAQARALVEARARALVDPAMAEAYRTRLSLNRRIHDGR